MTAQRASPGTLLIVRRLIHASAERLFEAWTEPNQLRHWFGPRGVRCADAKVDLRVGGQYRLVNVFSDGRLVTIVGEFSVIERPRRLVYSWQIEGSAATADSEIVTVRFDAHGDTTEVIVVHERIASEKTVRDHEAGWEGCLDALALYLSAN